MSIFIKVQQYFPVKVEKTINSKYIRTIMPEGDGSIIYFSDGETLIVNDSYESLNATLGVTIAQEFEPLNS